MPPNGIVVAATAAGPADRFALLSPGFIQLQLAMAQAMGLPTTAAEFEHRYGSFGPYLATDACQVLQSLHEQAAVFGDPAVLATELSTLAAGTKPTMLYGQLVWLTQRTTNTANAFRFTLQSLPDDLAHASTPEKRLRILTRLLTGDKSLAVAARQLETEARNLSTDLALYQRPLSLAKADIGQSFSTHTTIYEQAADLNQQLAAQLGMTQDQLGNFRSAYIDVATSSVLAITTMFAATTCMLIPVGVVAIGAYSMLSDMERMARLNVDRVETALRTLAAESWKKFQLVGAVKALELSLTPLETQLASVIDCLDSMADTWRDVARQLEDIVAQTTVADLQQVPAFVQRLHLAEAGLKWALTARLTTEFTTNAFVRIDSRA